jgi:uncharacterized protein YbjT (DUF2867 family)
MDVNKRVFFAGSSGEIGKRLLQNLLVQNSVKEIHLLTRSAVDTKDPRVKQYIVDFNDLSQLSIPNNQELDTIAFCTLGKTIKKAKSKANFRRVDLTYTDNFALWALNNNCNRMAVVSSVNADQAAGNFYLKTKGDMEAAIKSRHFKSLWIIRPSLLLGKRQEFRAAEKIGSLVIKALLFVFVGVLKKYKPIEMDVVADALSSLVNSNETGAHVTEGNDIHKMAEAATRENSKYGL